MKLWVALHDLALVAILLALARRTAAGPAAVIAYAWNPLVLVEYAGTGHNDPTAMAWLALALLLRERRPLVSALAFSAAVLVKLAPLAALPFLLRDWPWRARLAALALTGSGLAWFWSQTRDTYSGLLAYWGSWRNNELLFLALDRLLGGYAPARAASLVLVGLVAVWTWRRAAPPARATRNVLGAALLLSPVLHPWYLGWVLMFEPLALTVGWLALSATVVLNYGVFATPAEGGDFHLPLAWRWVEYGIPLALAAGAAVWTRRRRRGAAAEER
jgi:hypothetical protein